MGKTSRLDYEQISTVTYLFIAKMDNPYIKQTVYKVLKKIQHGKYLVAYALNMLTSY